MSKLSWLSDEDLYSAIDELKIRANRAKEQAGQRMKKNTVDPFASLIIAHTYQVQSAQELQSLQESASAQSGISSAVGHFHQRILGSINGWKDHDAGYDLENSTDKIVAEVKNKHNTMNASNRNKVQADLDTAVQQKGKDWKGYLVIIIPKTRERYNTRIQSCSRPVYEIDGASFYTLATGGVQTALADLHAATASVLHQEHSTHYGISEQGVSDYFRAELPGKIRNNV